MQRKLGVICAEHYPNYLQLLLDHPETDPNLNSADGWTPLLVTLQYHPDAIDPFLGHDKLNINQTNQDGVTPIMYALSKRPATIGKLISAGASLTQSVSAGGDSKRFRVCYLIAMTHPEWIPVLIGHGIRFTEHEVRGLVRSNKLNNHT